MVNILVQDEDVREPWPVLLNNKQTRKNSRVIPEIAEKVRLGHYKSAIGQKHEEKSKKR